MQEKSDVALSTQTSLRLGGIARRFVIAESAAEIESCVRAADTSHEPLFLLGGGSNVVIADEGFAGTVVRIDSRGVEVQDDDESVVVTVEAGEPWDDFVARAVDVGWAGVECLSGIPGLVGATPMQNVGAYGQDVHQCIEKVVAFDRHNRELVTIDASACAFGYRTSMFRGNSRFVIVRVVFRFDKSRETTDVRYAELRRALDVSDGSAVPISHVRETVIELRRGKGMVLDFGDPESVSAGSFFTNPIVDLEIADAVLHKASLQKNESMPRFDDESGKVKLSAAWLIERAGFSKGTSRGHASISKKHALALVNRGGTTRELVALAREIQEKVNARFDIALDTEPVFVGITG